MVIFSLLFSSCTKKVGNVIYGDYPQAVGKILVNKCATSGCHNDKSYLAASEYNMTTWQKAFEGSNNGSPIIPFSSKFSSLCSFINTYSDLGLQNIPSMPLSKDPLTHDEVVLIKDWIDAGAPDVKGNVMWGDDPLRKKLYATNQGCGVVTVFDGETQLPIRFIEVGRKNANDVPHQVRVSADGKYWYVVFIASNVMEKHRCSDDAFVANIPLTPVAAGTSTDLSNDDPRNWNTFIITKDCKRAYAVSLSGYLSAVDLENEKLLNFTAAGNSPHGSALSADESILYVGAQTANYVSAWLTDFSSYNQISLDGASPSPTLSIHDVVLSPNGVDLFVTCQGSNQVRILNTLTNSVTIIPVGVFPQEIAYSKNKKQYFISCPEDDITFPGSKGVITKIDEMTNTPTTIKCGYQPHGIGVDETKNLLYVLSRNILTSGPLPHHTSVCGRNGFVNFIDLNTFTVLPKKYELSADPYFVFARP